MRSSNGRGTVKRLIGMRPINRNFAADYAFLLKLYAYTKKAYGSCNNKKKLKKTDKTGINENNRNKQPTKWE